MSTMSDDSILKQRKKIFIYDLPYPERRKICQILDADENWKELGGTYMNIKPIELAEIGRAVYHKGSPTDELLSLFGTRNGTIDQLFVYLSHMNHQWAMGTILRYVSPKYHCLLHKSGMDFPSSEITSTKISKGNPSPTAPTKSQTWSSGELMGATGFDSAYANLRENPYNFNQSSSQMCSPAKNMSYAPQKPQANGHSPQPSRYNQSHTMNNNSSKDLNDSRVGYKNKYLENNGNAHQGRQDRSREHDIEPKWKLNIPFSSSHAGPVEKQNKVTEPNVPAPKSIEFESDMITKIPYSELIQATDHFDRRRILGQGGFGIVYKAYWKGNDVAVKKLSPKNKTDPRFAGEVSLKQSQTEMRVLMRCRIDNILPLYGVSLDGPEPCLVYQYMVNGSLEDRLLLKGNSRPLNWLQRSTIAWGTAKGLVFMHTMPDKPLIHGDIKSANILLDKDMEPKIGDFGLARDGPPENETHMKVSSVHGTQVYLPPEYLRNYQLSQKVDVYSYGIVLMEIATGLRAYNERLPKYRYIYELVNNSEISGDSLRDQKAGLENVEWFEEILRIGKHCASPEKRLRPDMEQVTQKFRECKQKMDMYARYRELSCKPPDNPTTVLTPLELQFLYDLQKGPMFPNGVQGPPTSLDPDLNLPTSLLNSFHPSDIREPPSQVDARNVFPTVESSRAATNGSSSKGEDMLPLLTELGTIQGTVSSGLSGIPDRDKVIVTPKMPESNMQLFPNDSGDIDDESHDDDDNESSLDSEGVFQMTDVKCQG